MADFWEASHNAAQEADDLGERSLAPYWHAIAHRREPDAGNAAYWYRRVGRHRLLAQIAEAARVEIPAEERPSWWGRVIGENVFDPMAFIEVCGRARGGTSDERVGAGSSALRWRSPSRLRWRYVNRGAAAISD